MALAALLKLFPAASCRIFFVWPPLARARLDDRFFCRRRTADQSCPLVRAGDARTARSRITSAGHAELTVLSFVRKAVAHLAGTTVVAEPLVAVWVLAALIDLALIAIAAAATITSHGRADLDGLVFGMWVALALLMSPLAWIDETLLLLPAFLFGLLAAWQGFQPREPVANPARHRVDCRQRDAR